MTITGAGNRATYTVRIQLTDAYGNTAAKDVAVTEISSINGIFPSNQTVIMSSSSTGGYVVSSSSNYDSNEVAWKAFDNNDSTFWTSTWASYSNGTYTGSVVTYQSGSGSPYITTSGGNVAGEWLQIMFPSAVRFRDFYIFCNTLRCPREIVILVSNNGSTWFWWYNLGNINLTPNAWNLLSGFDLPSSPYYKYYRIVFTALKNEAQGTAPVSCSGIKLTVYNE